VLGAEFGIWGPELNALIIKKRVRSGVGSWTGRDSGQSKQKKNFRDYGGETPPASFGHLFLYKCLSGLGVESEQ
jgi:hypothetical protein